MDRTELMKMFNSQHYSIKVNKIFFSNKMDQIMDLAREAWEDYNDFFQKKKDESYSKILKSFYEHNFEQNIIC